MDLSEDQGPLGNINSATFSASSEVLSEGTGSLMTCTSDDCTDVDAKQGLLYIQSETSAEDNQQTSVLVLPRNDSTKSPSRMFQCDYAECGRTFTTAAHLRYHTRTHTGEKPYSCSHEGCGRNFTSSGYLRYHQCTHSGKKTFKCQHPGCDRVFAWPAHMKYHLKTHTGDRAYHCSFEGCNKSFYVLQRLNVHMRVHTGERPYTCKVENCRKSFTTQGNLKNHMRIHTGERPYSCPVEGCGRTFTEHSSLRKHKLIHTGEKPYICEICGKRFSQSGSRNAHQKRHTDVNKDIKNRKAPSKQLPASVIVQGDERGQHGEILSHIENIDEQAGEDEASMTPQALVYSQDDHTIVTQATGDQLVLAQPIVAKEVSIETTPIPTMSLLVQTTDDAMTTADRLAQATADVTSLAETVATQQAVIHTMLDGAAIIPTNGQSELSVVDHVLPTSNVEHMMQSVVSQHILSGHIQIPLTEELEATQEQDAGTVSHLTIDLTGFMQQTQEETSQNSDVDIAAQSCS